MITTKIKRRSDDYTEPKQKKGSAADERAAMAALARKSGKSFFHVKTRAKRPGRGTPGGKGKSASRPRYEHLKDYSAIAEYLIEGDEKGQHPDGEGRVERITSFGVAGVENGTPLSLEEFHQVQGWMAETAALNTRIKNTSILHYVVSLPPEEKHKATPEFWNEVTLRVMDVLDLCEHQALVVEHKDVDHAHVHIVINRVHPTTHMAASPFEDMYKLEALKHQIEKEHGLKKVTGRLIDPATGKKYTTEQIKAGVRPDKRGPAGGANDFKKRAQLALDHSKPFSTSETWQELEKKLAEHGYHLEQKGGGLVLIQTDLPPTTARGEKQFNELKVSAIAGKGNGGGALEKRFGETWADYQAVKAEAAKQGVSIDVVKMQRRVNAEAERTDQTQARQAKADILKGNVASIWPVGPDTKRCGVEWGCESENELREIITSDVMPDKDLTAVREITYLKNEEAQAGMVRTANQSAEALRRTGEIASYSDWFNIERGTRAALEWLEAECKKRGLGLPMVADIDTVKAPAKVEPFLIDPDAPRSEQMAGKVKIKALDEAGLTEVLSVNRAAIADVKKLPRSPETAALQRSLTEGLNMVKGEFSDRRLAVPANPMVKAKPQSRSR